MSQAETDGLALSGAGTRAQRLLRRVRRGERRQVVKKLAAKPARKTALAVTTVKVFSFGLGCLRVVLPDGEGVFVRLLPKNLGASLNREGNYRVRTFAGPGEGRIRAGVIVDCMRIHPAYWLPKNRGTLLCASGCRALGVPTDKPGTYHRYLEIKRLKGGAA